MPSLNSVATTKGLSIPTYSGLQKKKLAVSTSVIRKLAVVFIPVEIKNSIDI